MRSRWMVIAVLAAGCSGGDGGDSESGPPGNPRTPPGPSSAGQPVTDGVQVRGLILSVDHAQGAGGGVRSVARFDVPESPETWRVEAGRTRIESDGEGARSLMIGGKGTKRLTIPGPIVDADQIVLMLSNGAHGAVRASLVQDGVVAAVAGADVLRGKARHPVAIDLPVDRDRSMVYDALVLEFDLRGQSELHSVDLVERSLASLLPSLESGFGHVAIGEVSRPVVGLASGDVLMIRTAADAPGQLRLGAGTPEGLPRPAVAQSVDLEWKRMDKEGATLEGGTNRTPLGGWTDLGAVRWAGEPGAVIQVTLQLRSEAEGDVCVVALPERLDVAESPQTVLLVTSDTHRFDHLGTTSGDLALDTPNLDAFAAGGVQFLDAFTTSNTTIPSHSALLTGLHPRDTKVLGNYSSLGGQATTLAERFSGLGYRTVSVISSSHLGDEYSGLGQGFDVVLRPASTERRAEEAIHALLEELSVCADAPVFCWLHLFDAHAPYVPPAEFDRRYYDAGANPFDQSLPPIDLEGGKLPLWLKGLRDTSFPRAQYRAEITYLDQQMGRLLGNDRVAGGVVAITSDHGEIFERQGVFFEHKGLIPDTLHVPLLLGYPGAAGGTRVARSVRQMDVGRTLLDLAGHGSVDFPGRSLLPEEEPTPDPRFALSRRFVSVTDQRWHATLTLVDLTDAGDGTWPERHTVELYDVAADPGCAVNLAAEHPDRVRRMRAAMVSWLQDQDTVMRASRPSLDRAARANLAALGYAEESRGTGPQLLDFDCECERCSAFR